MKSFRRNLKAISPIFATLILIAIAVIAGVVVYMFTSGTLSTMTGGGTAGQEKVAVQSASYTFVSGNATSTVTVLYQSTGGSLPTITGMLVKDSAGNTYGTTVLGTSGLTPTGSGALTQVIGTVTPGMGSGSYTVTLITKAGGSFVSPSFTVP